jgi:O-methyltransferase
VVFVDDYADTTRNPQVVEIQPGVRVACEEFLADKPERLSVLVGNGGLAMGWLRKQ